MLRICLPERTGCNMLSITEAKYKEICWDHFPLLLLEGDGARAVRFVRDLIEAEMQAIREESPEATAMINRLEAIAYDLSDIALALEQKDFKAT